MLTWVQDIKLDTYFPNVSSNEMKQLAKPLVPYNINHFSLVIQRFNAKYGLSYEVLSTHPRNEEYYINEKMYNSFITDHPNNYQPGYYFINDLINGVPALENYIAYIRNEVKVANLIYLVKKVNQTCAKFYCFGSSSNTLGMETFYLNNLNLLENFILNFEQVAVDLLKESSKHQYLLPMITEPSNFNKLEIAASYIDNKNTVSSQEIVTTFNKLKKDFQLTKAENKCAYLLMQGLTTKCIASQINRSPRTIEKHIAAIKTKMSCRYTNQLIYKLNQYT